MFSQKAIDIFKKSIADYHKFDNINQIIDNPYNTGSIEYLLYLKNWIDTIQWHYEDIIREPSIDPIEALKLKRKIDASNQHRTDTVEYIDSYLLEKYNPISLQDNATINTESPAWAIDRLSILILKIYHMQEETTRKNASQNHIKKCQDKLHILIEQEKDLAKAIDQLLIDIKSGKKYMKVYRQMKMYNDGDLNPILYKSNK